MATSFIPANETTFSLQGFKNGTLLSQLDPMSTVYQGHNQNTNITILPNNLASLTFNVDHNSRLAFELATVLFDPNRFLTGVVCTHPLSGQYDTLLRILFYVLIVVSLVFRRHVWISVAALGTAMTYAGASAVHLLALVTHFEFRHVKISRGWNGNSSKEFGDPDFYGICAILSASGIMLTPILMWSTSVKKHKAQAVVIYWGILIFIGLATAFCKNGGESGGFSLYTMPSFASCARIPESPFGTLDTGNVIYNVFTYDTYNDCECIDFCGTLGPATPMRKSANLVPWLVSTDRWIADQRIVDNANMQAINVLIPVFIIFSGAFGILTSHFSQEEVRNWVFRFCNRGSRTLDLKTLDGEGQLSLLEKIGREHETQKTPEWRKWRVLFAKSIAASFFISAIVTTVFCPICFAIIIISSEIAVSSLPVSEFSDSVGAWASWVSIALVLTAALIEKLSEAGRISFSSKILSPATGVFQYPKSNRPHYSEERQRNLWDKVKLFLLELASPFIHAWYSVWGALWTAKTTIYFFVLWWKDPEEVSDQNGAAIERAWEDRIRHGKPSCPCGMCERDRKKDISTLNEVGALNEVVGGSEPSKE